jgi:hypothetical protein
VLVGHVKVRSGTRLDELLAHHWVRLIAHLEHILCVHELKACISAVRISP